MRGVLEDPGRCLGRKDIGSKIHSTDLDPEVARSNRVRRRKTLVRGTEVR